MPATPYSWTWHVNNWQPNGAKRYRRVTRGLWEKSEALVLQVQETGDEQHFLTGEYNGKTRTRWRDARPSDLCGELA